MKIEAYGKNILVKIKDTPTTGALSIPIFPMDVMVGIVINGLKELEGKLIAFRYSQADVTIDGHAHVFLRYEDDILCIIHEWKGVPFKVLLCAEEISGCTTP